MDCWCHNQSSSASLTHKDFAAFQCFASFPLQCFGSIEPLDYKSEIVSGKYDHHPIISIEKQPTHMVSKRASERLIIKVWPVGNVDVSINVVIAIVPSYAEVASLCWVSLGGCQRQWQRQPKVNGVWSCFTKPLIPQQCKWWQSRPPLRSSGAIRQTDENVRITATRKCVWIPPCQGWP